MVRTNKLRAKIVEKGMTIEAVADRLKLNRSTLYRKLQDTSGKSFTVNEVRNLAQILDLSAADITAIFFSEDVA